MENVTFLKKKLPLPLEILEKILIFYIESRVQYFLCNLVGVGFIKRFILPHRPSSRKPFEDDK